MAKHTIVIGDRVWPSLYVGDIERILKYGSTSDIIGTRFTAASIVDAYRTLLIMPAKERDTLIKQIVALSNEEDVNT
jgi:hypothetical protein